MSGQQMCNRPRPELGTKEVARREFGRYGGQGGNTLENSLNVSRPAFIVRRPEKGHLLAMKARPSDLERPARRTFQEYSNGW